MQIKSLFMQVKKSMPIDKAAQNHTVALAGEEVVE